MSNEVLETTKVPNKDSAKSGFVTELITKEFTFKEEKTIIFPAGYKYIYLVDPKTDKIYDFGLELKITGDNLGDLFQEVTEH